MGKYHEFDYLVTEIEFIEFDLSIFRKHIKRLR